jgi:hypothetical protein
MLPPTRADSLFLHYRWEDRHVIAFCADHPVYEAVEAFVSYRHGPPPLVRAILTRHDKRQVDYVNDAAIVTAMRAAGGRSPRDVHRVPVQFDEIGARHTTLRFVAADGERFAFELRTVGPALSEFGGLTDPKGHAPDLLPVMWRARSAIGGPGTTLTANERPCAVAMDPATGGLAAYYTEGFGMGIVGTGTPAAAGRTTVETTTVDGRPRAHAVHVASPSETASTMVVAFTPFLPDQGDDAVGARFTIAIDDHADLVTGRVESRRDGIVLVPESPAWAASRIIRL